MGSKKAYWLLIIAAIILSLIGIFTGWYFFLLLIFPLGAFSFGKKDKKDDE